MLIDNHYLLEKYNENTKYTCTDVSAEYLSSIVFKIQHDMFSDMRIFHEGTYRVDLSALTKADWEEIRYLCVLGSADFYTNRSLVKNNIRPGAYLNKSGNFLLIVNLNESKIQLFLNRYGAKIVHFSLWKTKLPALSLDMMPDMETLDLHGNIALTQIEGLDKLENLNRINVSQCDKLTEIPRLDNLPHLTDLDIRDCQQLTTLQDPTTLSALKTVEIASCPNISILPDLKGFANLTTLNLAWCEYLSEIPELSDLVSLTSLHLMFCHSIPELIVGNTMRNLTCLEIQDCKALKVFPQWDRFPSLKSLNLSSNEHITELHLESACELTSINLFGCVNLVELTGLNNLIKMSSLDLSYCSSLCELEELSNLTRLTSLNLSYCSNLTDLSPLGKFTELADLNLWGCEKLKKLDLNGCKSLTEIHGINTLFQLIKLNLSQCIGLRSLNLYMPKADPAPRLAELNLSDCSNLRYLCCMRQGNLTTLIGLETLSSLTHMDLKEARKIVTLHGIEKLTQLISLDLSYCTSLIDLAGLHNFTQLTNLNLFGCVSLKVLDLTGCIKLTEVRGVNTLCQMTSLNLSKCENLTDLNLELFIPLHLEDIAPTLTSQLTELNLSGCCRLTKLRCWKQEKLSTLLGLDSLPCLTEMILCRATRISALPGLDRLTQLRKLVLEDCYNLIKLPSLDDLTKLTTLILRGCRSLNGLLGLGNLTQLTQLDLNGCQSLIGLPGLGNLTQLTHLDLNGCSNLSELPPIDTLTKLTALNFSGCKSLTGLSGLGNLTQVTRLDLGGCSSLIELPGLANLTQLESLDIDGCSSLTELPLLDGFRNIRRLNVSFCDSLRKITGIKNFTKLKDLRFYNCCSLTDMPILCDLPSLDTLDLSGCSSLVAIPKLVGLNELHKLDLTDCHSLAKIPEVSNPNGITDLRCVNCTSLSDLSLLNSYTQLTDLNLSGCSGIVDWPDFSKLKRLKNLDLSGTGITKIPESIRYLKNIESLNLSDLSLEKLPEWLPEIADAFSLEKKKTTYRSFSDGWNQKATVYLQNTTVDSEDMSIFNQPYEMVLQWFEERKKGNAIPLNEIKVVFLGDGEAGKTHTIARLLNDGGYPKDFDDRSTPGIVIKNKNYKLGGRKIQIHYWDFGGQEILHSMHRIFLTNRTMYVILLNARDDTQGDRARYWIHNVKSFAPGAPVLLVLNKIDQNPKASVNEQDLRSRYDKITKVVRLSARDYTPMQFNREFTKVLLEEIHKTGFLSASWPVPWTKVKAQLEQMKGHYIMGDAYETICKKCAVKSNQKKLLHWFNDLGVSFCFCDEQDYALKDYVILRPDWITNALYIILFNECEGAGNGLLPHKAIYKLLTSVGSDQSIRCVLPTARYTTGDIHYVLGVLRKFHLSFPYGTDYEFIPMLCQQNSKIDTKNYRTDTSILEFSMEFDYLPNNLLHRLMVERNQELDMANVWRTGARFQQEELGLSAVVIIDSNTLRFFIFHAKDMHRPNTYLAMLKVNVDRIWRKMGLKEPVSQIIYKMDDKTEVFDYKRLITMLEAGQKKEFSMTWNRLLDISDILNQAAPDGLEEENELLKAIVKSCEQIQREPECRGSKEDNRNRRMRDTLQNFGYDTHDQTQMGTSSSGKGAGELDMMLYRKDKTPWSVIEALRISDGDKRDWNGHLGKLLYNYNPHGVPYLFLVTYADCDKVKFDAIWRGYQNHVRKQHAGEFEHVLGSDKVITEVAKIHYLNIMRSQYRCGEYVPTVYHIFVQIDPPSK